MAVPTPDSSRLFPQKISVRATISDATTGALTVTLPTNATVYLEGYGHSWFDDGRFRLVGTDYPMPWASNQQGSVAQPWMFSRPMPCQAGQQVQLLVENSSGASQTVDGVFYFLTDRQINVDSTGGEIITATQSGSGTASFVTIQNSAGSVQANVTAKGLEVESQAPATLRDGTLVLSTTAAALSSSTALKKGVLIQNPSTNTINAIVGNATSQNTVLEPGREIFIEIDNLNAVYVKSASGTPTINYLGS